MGKSSGGDENVVWRPRLDFEEVEISGTGVIKKQGVFGGAVVVVGLEFVLESTVGFRFLRQHRDSWCSKAVV